MRKTAVKTAHKAVSGARSKTTPTKVVSEKVAKSANSVDDLLAEHLKQAEHHLIAAVKLFYGPSRPSRVHTYLRRLEKAQEAITGLYREELVRIRGPIKNKR